MTALSVHEFLADLRERGVSLTAEGDRIRCRAPHGVLTGTLLAAIRTRKSELLTHLRTARRLPRHEGPGQLSFAQERMWLLHQLHPEDSAYNIPLEIALSGPLRHAALRDALGQLLRRHAVLRTRYAVSRGRPRPVIEAPRTPALPVADLRGLAEADRSAAAARLAAEEARRPFALETGPMLRAVLVRVARTEHRLLLTRHHIGSDGWSLDILCTELGALYRAHSDGVPDGLDALPASYADYAAWQRERAGRPEHAEQVARRAEQLVGAPPTLDLLAPPPAEPSYTPAVSLRTTLAGGLVGSLRKTAGASGVTLFSLLLSAFGLALAWPTGQREVVIGCPFAGRDRAELEPLIGCFASVLPLRLDPRGTPTLAELAAQAQQGVQEALDAPEVTFEHLLRRLRPHRTLTDNPLFAVSFTFQNTPRTAVELPGLRARVLPAPPVAPKFPLALTATERAGAVDLDLEYAPDRLAAPAAEQLLDRLREILAGTAADPDLPAGAVLRRAARAETPQDRLPGRQGQKTLHQLVEAAAARRPEAIAVSCQGAQLSYGALNTRADRLALALRAHGAGPEHLVGLCLPPGISWVIGALAILKSGAAYLPLDATDPAERRSAVAADAGLSLIVSETELPPLHRIDPVLAAAPSTAGAPHRPPTPANLAYAIYTSGSTAGPKGVLVTHTNITGLLAACRETLPALTSPRTWSMTHSPAFDFSVWEVWGALTTGGRLVVVPPDVARATDELWDTLRDEQVAVLSQTPSAFRALAPAASRTGSAPAALELVVLGGEACDPRQLRPWFEAVGDERPALVNMYGITETTVHVTSRRMTAADSAGSPVGVPLPGQRADVLGTDGRPVGPGRQGEVFIGGVGLARGYLGRPGLTADRFGPDGTPGAEGARRYRSGDLARLLPGGELAYLGRADAQVKLRGYRVEPGEIEAAARTHPAIRDCAVVPRDDGGRQYLAAYVTLAGACAAAELRAYLANRLPRHLVPAAVVPLESLPLTRNGKLDTGALPALAEVRGQRPPDQGPRTGTERTLVRMLAALLKAAPESIGVHDNLFDLGGDSLTVTQFHARVVEEFAVELPVRRVYRALDIAGLAATVEESRRQREHEAVLSALTEAESLVLDPTTLEGESCPRPE